jgi:hypothetical protein
VSSLLEFDGFCQDAVGLSAPGMVHIDVKNLQREKPPDAVGSNPFMLLIKGHRANCIFYNWNVICDHK